jgi:hypothetical protein
MKPNPIQTSQNFQFIHMSRERNSQQERNERN